MAGIVENCERQNYHSPISLEPLNVLFVLVCGKRCFTFVIRLRNLRWRKYPELFWWIQPDSMGLKSWRSHLSVVREGDMTVEESWEECNTVGFENDRRMPQAKEGWPLGTRKYSLDITLILVQWDLCWAINL